MLLLLFVSSQKLLHLFNVVVAIFKLVFPHAPAYGPVKTRAATMEGWQDQSLQQHHRTDVVADGGGSSGIGVSYDYDAFISCSSF